MSNARTHFDLTQELAQVLLIDVQERFVPAIDGLAADPAAGSATKVMATILQGSDVLGIPVTITEQAPDKLGCTLPGLSVLAPADSKVLSKHHFSCFDDVTIRRHCADLDKPQLVIMGIEAHICVLATVDDALRRGYEVVVISDAVASRQTAHAAAGVTTMRQLGAMVVPAESVLLRWQRCATGDQRTRRYLSCHQ